jgi:hypothetical protein
LDVGNKHLQPKPRLMVIAGAGSPAIVSQALDTLEVVAR